MAFNFGLAAGFTFTKTCFSLLVIQKLLHINFLIDCKQSMFLYKIKDNFVTIV